MTTKEAIAVFREMLVTHEQMDAFVTITRQLRKERKVFRALSEYCELRYKGMCEMEITSDPSLNLLSQ